MNTAIYARVSTGEQDCTIQLEELRRYVSARGWVVVGEYVDDGVSGVKASRPALDRLMEDVSARRIDVVVVWKLDRFSRSTIQFLRQVEALDAAGVRFIATSQGIDTDKSNPTARLFMQIIAAVAEFDRQMILERTSMGRAKAVADGVVMGRPRLVIDRLVVKEMREAGKSVREIAAKVGASVGKVHGMLKEGL
jgi:DNA invertase Pin-like site-specific DNA recombinase